jgi:hypothetical protein
VSRLPAACLPLSPSPGWSAKKCVCRMHISLHRATFLSSPCTTSHSLSSAQVDIRRLPFSGTGEDPSVTAHLPPFRLHSLANPRRFRSILIGLALSDLGYDIVGPCTPAAGVLAVRRSVHASAVVGESVLQVTVRAQEAYREAAGLVRWRRLPLRRSYM